VGSARISAERTGGDWQISVKMQLRWVVAPIFHHQMLGESYGAGWCMRTTAFGLVGRLCRDNRGAKLIKFAIALLPLLDSISYGLRIEFGLE
jgi:hypothetical protein